MKTISRIPAPSDYFSGKAHALWRYLDRLADGWEYARDEDMVVLEGLLDDLEREISYAGPDALPISTADFVASTRRAMERARGSTMNMRMQHLEAAEGAIETLLTRLPARA